MGKIRKGRALRRVGIRRAYKQVRNTVLTMNTPKYFSFALQIGSYCTTLHPTSTVITQPVILALNAQVPLPLGTGPQYSLGWYPAPYTSDSISSQAGLRSDRCYLKTMRHRFVIGPEMAGDSTNVNPCIGVRIIKFHPKGIALIARGEGAITNNPSEGFPTFWWQNLSPVFFQHNVLLSDSNLYWTSPFLSNTTTVQPKPNQLSAMRSFAEYTCFTKFDKVLEYKSQIANQEYPE